MKKEILGYGLLILVTFTTYIMSVLKRKAILGFDEINLQNALSIKFWFSVLTNLYVVGIFTVSILMFMLTLITLSFLTADKVLVMGWTLMVPSFLITAILNLYLLQEKFNYSKIPYLIILFISVLISIYGAWGYLK